MVVTEIMHTHEVFKKLLKHDFTEKQAEGITEVIAATAPNPDHYVRKEIFEDSKRERCGGKSDVASMKSDLLRLESKIDSGLKRLESKIDSGLERLESKIDSGLERLESKMTSDLKQLELKIQFDIKSANLDLLKWMSPVFITLIIGVIGPLVLKFFA